MRSTTQFMSKAKAVIKNCLPFRICYFIQLATAASLVPLLLGRDWPQMMDLARWRLAQLYLSASRYAEALQLLVKLRDAPPHPEIPRRILTVRLAETLLLSGRPLDARRELESHTSEAEGSRLDLEARKLLAEVYEELGRSDAAAECYRRILASPGAGKKIKVADCAQVSRSWLNRTP